MMASSLPLATTGLRHPPPSMAARHANVNVYDDDQGEQDPSNWCAWAHQGHRLWEGMPESFWILTYKVELCPFPGNHLWTACPYAHRREHARRRDPSRFPYAAAPCPDYAASRRRLQLAGSPAPPHCPRGVACGLAHGVFEVLLHPARFRTQMCDAGAGCPRRVCFFAHSAAQRRRHDDSVPGLVVFPAATPPPSFVPRPPAAAAAYSSSSRSLPVSSVVVARSQVDRVTQAVQQQGHSVRLLTHHSDGAAAGACSSSSSSSSSSRALVSTGAVGTVLQRPPLLQGSPLLLQASPPSAVDDDDDDDDEEDVDFVDVVMAGCRLAAEEDAKQGDGGHDYPHLDLIMDIVRS